MAKRNYQRRESGLIVPDDTIVVPRVRDRHDVGSRRGMSRRRCCGSGSSCINGCKLFSDTFDSSASLDNWNQTSGTWSVSGGELITSNSNALILAESSCIESEWGSDFHNHIVAVSLKASTGNYSRIIFSYESGGGTYNYAEVYWSGTSSKVYIKTSAGATIATSADLSFTNGTVYRFRVCVTANSAVVNYGITTPDTYAIAGSVSSTTTSAGLGTGTTSAQLAFDIFSVEQHYSENSECDRCYIICSGCNPPVGPDFMQVVVSGLVNGTCTCSGATANCTQFNGTWVLSKYGTCGWRYIFGTTACPAPCGWTNAYIHAEVYKMTTHIARVYFGSTNDQATPYWLKNYGATPPNCSGYVNESLPWAGPANCACGVNGTCTLTAL